MIRFPETKAGNVGAFENQLLQRARLCCLVAASIFLASLIGIRYVTNDDIWQAAWTWSGDWLAVGHQLAVAHGRLYKPANLWLFVPYLIDHPVYYAIAHIGPIVLATILFAKLFRLAVPIVGVGSLYVLLFFALAQNSFEHNPFSAVPFVWEAAWAFFLSGALLLHWAIDKQRMAPALLGATLTVFGLIEAFVPLVVLLFAIAAFSIGGVRRNGRYLLPYFIAIVAWIGAWLWWRQQYPTQYEGSSLGGNVSPTRILETIWTYGAGGAPFATLWNDTAVATMSTFREGFGVAWIAKAIAVGAGLVFLGSVFAGQQTWRVSWKHIIFTMAAIVLPVALLGLTPKYQQWVQNGSHAYVYSHFSYFAWVALSAMLVVCMAQHFRNGAFLAVLAIVGAAGSLLTDWSNYETNLQQKLSARKWEIFDGFLKSGAYANVPDGSRVHYFGLDMARGIAATDPIYWTYYSKARTGKNVQFISGLKENDPVDKFTYALVFADEAREYDQSIIFAKIAQSRNRNLVTQNFSLLVNTRNDSLGVSGSYIPCSGEPCNYQVSINNEEARKSTAPVFYLGLGVDQCEVCEFEWRLSESVYLATIRVSFNRQTPSRMGAARESTDPILAYGFDDRLGAESLDSE